MNYLKSLFAASLLLTGTAANAIVISYSDTFSMNSQTSSSVTNNGSLSLQGFDASLGNLTGVDVSFTSQWDHAATATATDTQSTMTQGGCVSVFFTSICVPDMYTNDAETNVDFTSQFNITLLSSPSNLSVNANDALGINCSDAPGAMTSAYTATCTSAASTAGNFDGTIDVSSLDLTSFITNDINFSLTNILSNNILSCGSGDYCANNNSSNWGGQLNIAYTYENFAVSAPATFALFGLGLLGMVASRKKVAA